MPAGAHTGVVTLPVDLPAAYGAVSGRDARWDGRLYLGVTSTGIYCRPSCPARTPLPENCRYFPTAAAAVAAGFRACRRCRPDALPGTRDWDVRGDLAARAVRLIADGALDDGGVAALARRLAVSERHLHRVLVTEVGASPQQLGRTRRAHTARTLIEQTPLALADIAFAAGFGSIRQFNDVMRAEFGQVPTAFRRPSGDAGDASGAPSLTLRLTYRSPLEFVPLRRTLAAHAIGGVEVVEGCHHLRVIDAPTGPAVVRIDLSGVHADSTGVGSLPVTLHLASLADLMPVVGRVRRWLDLDADPHQIESHFAGDEILGPLVAARPGLRVPGAVDPAELAICAVLGQQVSLAAARTFQSRIAAAFGDQVGDTADGHDSGRQRVKSGTHRLVAFPRASVLAEAGPQKIRDAANLTQKRAQAVHALATALSCGLSLGSDADPVDTRTKLLAVPGIGPWTADYISLRALRDPDAFMPSDLVLRKALATAVNAPLQDVTPTRAATIASPWSPWRSYALQHLWTSEVYA